MAECAPNHLRSLAMALGLMTNWLFNFVIAKITPTLLASVSQSHPFYNNRLLTVIPYVDRIRYFPLVRQFLDRHGHLDGTHPIYLCLRESQS